MRCTPTATPPSSWSPTGTLTTCSRSRPTSPSAGPLRPPALAACPVLDRTRDRAHGRVELRTLKAVSVRGFGFPHTAQVIQVTRRIRDLRSRRWRTVTGYAVTSLTHAQASSARLADLLGGHWAIENGLHDVCDVTFPEDASQVWAGTGPQVMACPRNLVIGALSRAGPINSLPRSVTTAATHADHSPP
jgi:hypothetical protein